MMNNKKSKIIGYIAIAGIVSVTAIALVGISRNKALKPKNVGIIRYEN